MTYERPAVVPPPGDNGESVTVVVPAYNEEKRIGEALKQIRDALEATGLQFEIIPVDDGSRDTTREIMDLYARDDQRIRPVSYSPNRGKGHAVRRGMLASRGSLLLFTDCDLSTPLAELPRFLQLARQYDIVVASRALPTSIIPVRQPFHRRVLGTLSRWLVAHVLGLDIRDTQCGFKLFRRRALGLFKKQKIDGFGFDFEILFLAKQEGFSVKEVGVTWQNGSGSKVRLLDFPRTLLELIRVRQNSRQGIY